MRITRSTLSTLALSCALALSIAFAVAAETPTSQPTTAKALDIPKAPGFPADYKGTPYQGIPQEIPGRVELENFDEGGYKVAYKTEHHEGTSSGKDYRSGPNPQICVTNNPLGPDKLEDGSRYPAKGESHFIGWAKPNDWVNCTVNVKKAGVYHVNTTASNETKKMNFSISFNDVKKASVEAEGSGGYHTWKVHENICTVKLDAGLQVMKFQLGSIPHMNYDYLEFVYDEKASADTVTTAPATH